MLFETQGRFVFCGGLIEQQCLGASGDVTSVNKLARLDGA